MAQTTLIEWVNGEPREVRARCVDGIEHRLNQRGEESCVWRGQWFWDATDKSCTVGPFPTAEAALAEVRDDVRGDFWNGFVRV